MSQASGESDFRSAYDLMPGHIGTAAPPLTNSGRVSSGALYPLTVVGPW